MHQNSCLAWSAVGWCCALQRNLWKASPLKLRPNVVKVLSQTHKMGNLQHTSIVFSLLMCCFKLMHHLMAYILPWVTEKSQEAGASLHMLGPLQWLYNAQTLFCIYVFLPRNLGVFFWQDLPPRELAFGFGFGMVIWNDSKQKSSHQEVMHNSGNWTECYEWSAGLKRKCRLAMAPPQTWKRHMKYCHPYPAWQCRVHRIPSSVPFTCLFYKYSYERINFCFNSASLGHNHSVSLFTNEEERKAGLRCICYFCHTCTDAGLV